jgi:predicted transcriptional regulator
MAQPLPAKGIVARDIGPGLAAQHQRLWRIDHRHRRGLPINQPMQEVEDVRLGRNARIKRQLLGTPTVAPPTKQEPAVSIRNSIKPDFIVCLEDGKKMKMLKRHLMTAFGMTPDAYRAKWDLPASYPMVAPNYAEKRRALAITIGLGRKPGKGRK